MQGDLQAFLWDDLGDVRARLQHVEAALRALQAAIDEGRVDQPSRQDSKRLNRMLVLAELLSSEVRPWIEQVLPIRAPDASAAHNGNGHHVGGAP